MPSPGKTQRLAVLLSLSLVASLVVMALAPSVRAAQTIESQRPIGGFGVPADPQMSARIRTIEAGPAGFNRRPIDSEVTSADEIIEIVDRQPMGTPPPPPEGQSPFDFAVRQAVAVAVVEVRSVVGELTSDRRWINSSVRALVTRLLKRPADETLSEGGEVVFTSPGGEVVIEKDRNKVTVRAGRIGDLPFLPGHSYVVPLGTYNGTWWVKRYDSAEIWEDRIRPLSTHPIALFRGRSDATSALSAVVRAASVK